MPYVGAVLMLGEWVDFHWEVNGKAYDFSSPGGGFLSFARLAEELGIQADRTVKREMYMTCWPALRRWNYPIRN